MSLIVTLCIGIGYKLRVTLRLTLIASLIHRVMLLTLSIAVLLSLPCLFLIRRGILGTIRIGVFY